MVCGAGKRVEYESAFCAECVLTRQHHDVGQDPLPHLQLRKVCVNKCTITCTSH